MYMLKSNIYKYIQIYMLKSEYVACTYIYIYIYVYTDMCIYICIYVYICVYL